jgi:hypothetical protein
MSDHGWLDAFEQVSGTRRSTMSPTAAPSPDPGHDLGEVAPVGLAVEDALVRPQQGSAVRMTPAL